MFCGSKCNNKHAKMKQKERNQKRQKDAGFINCKFCEKQTKALNTQGRRRIYCSVKCKSDNRVLVRSQKFQEKLSEIINCGFCNKETPKYNDVKGTERKYCSKECTRKGDHLNRRNRYSEKYKEALKEVKCLFCGKELVEFYKSTRNIKKFCPGSCRNKYHTLIKRKPKLVVNFKFTENDWIKLKERFDNRCAYCSVKTNLALDHVIPITKCGEHRPGNFLPACKRCNSSKNNKNIIEWKVYLKNKGINVNKILPLINLSERHIIYPNSINTEEYTDSISVP